jgi:drug/metabolite transporter, DME family
LGTVFGVISALAYTATNLTLRGLADSQSLDWAVWISCLKGVPAAVIAWILVAHRAWRGLPALPPRRLVIPLIAMGLFMQFVGNVCFQWGLSLGGLALTVPLTFATLIGSGAVLGRIVLGEPITLRSVLAIGMLVISIAVLSLGAEEATRSTLAESSWTVILLAILSASLAGLAYGTCGVMIRRTTTGADNVSLSGTLVWLSTSGVVGLGLVSWLRMGTAGLLETTTPEFLNMLLAGSLNAVAFFACGAALMRLSVVRVNLINASQAALCAAGGVLLFDEALTLWVVLGTLLTMGGLMLMDRSTPTVAVDESFGYPAASDRAGFETQRIAAETFVRSCECHAELPSTNDRALELAHQAELQTPALVLTERQTAGRGRGINSWWSADGALTFSLILDARECGLAPDRWPQVSLTAGLAICEALETFIPRGQLKLKWPNDVMLAGKKLCGILSEIPSTAKGRIVVGVGINVNNSFQDSPPALEHLAGSLADFTASRLDLTEVLIRVLQQMELEFSLLAEGPLEFSKRFRERCWLNGREVSIASGLAEIQGFCNGIDEEGALLVQTTAGTERILSGTVTAIG